MFNWLQELSATVRRELSQTFRSLRHRDYLTYSAGQLVSLTGTWMQTVALIWITYSLTQSAWILGLVGLCSNVPILTLSLFGGMVADRFNRRKVLIITQWLSMTLAVILGSLVFTHNLQVWMILALASIQGVISAFEVPCRQAIVSELVGGNDMVNAISLNSVIFNTTRMVGPAIGAVLLASFGETICFALNALSFVAALITLYRLPEGTTPEAGENRQRPSILEGLKVVAASPEIRNVLVLTAFTSLFGFQFAVLLPVFVKTVFHAEATTLGLLTSAAAFGSLAGSLLLANRGKGPSLKRGITWAACGVAVTLFAFALSSSLTLTIFLEILIGLSISIQLNSSNSLLQLSVPEELRGRVMSVYTMILLGISPLGSVIIGRAADTFGAPLAVAFCAALCGVSALFYLTRK